MSDLIVDSPDDRPARPTIRVVVDDLAFVVADAVLRPADELLNPVTPTAARLDQLAGEKFAQQRRVTTAFEPGAAVVTGAGDLTAPFVIHLVIRNDQTPVRPDVVRRALVSAWQRARDWQLATIAAPLVGMGAGQLGLEEAATLITETFMAAGSGDTGGELCIVVDRDGDREIVEAIARRQA